MIFNYFVFDIGMYGEVIVIVMDIILLIFIENVNYKILVEDLVEKLIF